MRKSTLLCLTLAVVCGTGIFRTSQRVHDGHEKIAALNIEIGKEQESLRVLNAEWSYLNQPERLEKLSKLYLHLAPMKGSQFVKAEDIPMRGAVVAEAASIKKVVITMPPKGGIRHAAEPQFIKAHAMHAHPDPALRRGGEALDDNDDDNSTDDTTDNDTPDAKAFITPVKSASLNKPATANTHNFSDLMKNLRSGVE